jgi:hypothetical protein
MKTEIAFILDRSGSMSTMAHAAISGFNEFLLGQQNTLDDQQRSMEANLTLVLFDTEYLMIHDRAPLKNALPLTSETYQPRGSTALLDAIGRTIDELGAKLAATPEADRPVKVIVAILTDGEENASRQFTMNEVNQRITHQTNQYAWEFLFLGANQDAIATAAHLGIAAHQAASFCANVDDLDSANKAFSKKISASRKFAAAMKLNAEEQVCLNESVAETLVKERNLKQ